MILDIIIAGLVFLLLLRIAYVRGLDKRDALYLAELKKFKRDFEAETEARAKLNRQFTYYYYFGGILVGVLCVWLWFKWREA